MDIRKVKKLIELLESSDIAEIEIKEGEESVRISRGSISIPAPMAYQEPAAPSAAPALSAVAPAAAAPAEAAKLALTEDRPPWWVAEARDWAARELAVEEEPAAEDSLGP